MNDMGFFINNPVLEPLKDGERWLLKETFTYVMNNGNRIDVPFNFITDFASVPKLFWNILPPWGKYGRAAIIHDYLYFTLGLDDIYSRKECDKIFLEAMVTSGAWRWKRQIMYYAVRLFGWFAWNKYKRRTKG